MSAPVCPASVSSDSARSVARTPAKLESLLLAAGVSKVTLDQHLTIVSGNALDLNSVKETLRSDSGAFASLIVFGVGKRCSSLGSRDPN